MCVSERVDIDGCEQVLSRVLAGLEQQKGVRSSMVLCIFWLGLALGQLVPFCTIIIMQVGRGQDTV